MVAELCSTHLFVGLGNPGSRYAKTRHNLGSMVVEEFAKSLNWQLHENKNFHAKVAKGRINSAEVHLVLPQVYMNESGWSIRRYLDYYKLNISSLVVVSDDTVLKFGQIRLRSQGSSGGHNGLKSIIACLGTEKFARLRMGIDTPKIKQQDLADYVLEDFTEDEAVALDSFVKSGAAILKLLTNESITNVMNQVNTKLTL